MLMWMMFWIRIVDHVDLDLDPSSARLVDTGLDVGQGANVGSDHGDVDLVSP